MPIGHDLDIPSSSGSLMRDEAMAMDPSVLCIVSRLRIRTGNEALNLHTS